MAGNFKIFCAMLLGHEQYFAYHLRANQSERLKSTIHLCGIILTENITFVEYSCLNWFMH